VASTTTIGDTPPVSPAVGDAWWDSVEGQLYVWFNDGTSSQWVPASNQPGAAGPSGPAGVPGPTGQSVVAIGDVPPANPQPGDTWWDGISGQLYIWVDDGTSQQWVIAVNQLGPEGPPGPRGPKGDSYSGGPGGPLLPTPELASDLPGLCNGSLETLYDQVQLQIPGVTTDNVKLQAWRAIFSFYTSSTYRREHVFWRMDPGVATLSFDPWDAHWRVCRFLGFRGLSKPKFEPPGRVRDLSYPIPDTTRSGEVILALRPDCIDAPLGDDAWAMWFDTFLAGTLSRLFMQPGKPYSDAQMGKLQALMFRHGVVQARAHVQSGYITEGVSWSFPYYAGGRQ